MSTLVVVCPDYYTAPKEKRGLLPFLLCPDCPVAHRHAPSVGIGSSGLVGVEVLDHMASLGDDVESARSIDCKLAHSKISFRWSVTALFDDTILLHYTPFVNPV